MKNKKVLAGMVIILAVSVIGIVSYFCFTGEEFYRTIKVTEFDGEVELLRDKMGKVSLYENIRLQNKDEVTTGDNSYAYLSLDEDKYIYAEENTDLKIEGSGEGNNTKTKIILKKGCITSEIMNSLSEKSNYEIETPNSTMSVRGTVFRVEVKFDKNGDSYTKLSVYDGKVSSTLIFPDGSRKDEFIVPVNYGVDIHGDKQISEYILRKVDSKNEEVHLLNIEELPSSALKVLLIIIDHNQAPDFICTKDEVQKIYEKKLKEERIETATLETYKVTIYDNNNTISSKKIYNFGDLVDIKTPSKQGYTFSGWYSDIALTIPVNLPIKVEKDISIYPSFIPNKDTQYCIATYIQDVNSSSYSLGNEYFRKGTTDSTVVLAASSLEGMTYNSRKSDKTLKILANGKAIAKVYYDRNTVKYTFDGIDYTKDYGTIVNLTQPTKVGYDFKEFNTSKDGTGDKVDPKFTLTKSKSIYSIFIPRTDVKYKMISICENFSKDGDLVGKESIQEGTADAAIPIPSIEGMTFNKERSNKNQNLHIQADGSSVVYLYYTRNLIKYTIDDVDYYAPYGSEVILPKIKEKIGYIGGYYLSKDTPLGEQQIQKFNIYKNTVFYVRYTPRTDIKYTIKTGVQKVTGGSSDDDYVWTTNSLGMGTANTTVSIGHPTKEGFHVNENSTTSLKISPDGKAVAIVKYDRNSIKYTIDGNEKVGLYGSKVNLIAPAKEFYEFKGFYVLKNGKQEKIEMPFTLIQPIDISLSYQQVTAKYIIEKRYEQENGEYTEYTSSSYVGSVLENVTFEEEKPGYEKVSQTFKVEKDGSTKIQLDYHLIKLNVYNCQYSECNNSITNNWQLKTYYAINLLQSGDDYSTGKQLLSQLERDEIKFSTYYLNGCNEDILVDNYEFKYSQDIYSSSDTTKSSFTVKFYLDGQEDPTVITFANMYVGNRYTIEDLCKTSKEFADKYDAFLENYNLDTSLSTSCLYLVDRGNKDFNIYMTNKVKGVLNLYFANNYCHVTKYYYEIGSKVYLNILDSKVPEGFYAKWYYDSAMTKPAPDMITVEDSITLYEKYYPIDHTCR